MFDATAVRYARIRSDDAADLPIPTDDAGFLDDAALIQQPLSLCRPGDVVQFDVLKDAQALVVFGEPGIGKTTALAGLRQIFENASRRVSWMEGGDLTPATFDDDFGSLLIGTSQPEGAAPGELVVMLDSLDESPLVHRFVRALGKLRGADRSVPTLVIGCRTADVPAGLIDALARLVGEPPTVVDVAPLRRVDAIALLDASDLDGRAVIDAAIDLGAGSLAAVPLTLGLLAREYQRHEGLKVPASALFERGVTMLLEESTEGSSDQLQSTMPQRRAIAARVAAVMLLSGRRTVHTGKSLDAGSTDLRASDLVGGTESAPAGQFDVTQQLVRETLSTALFAGRGSDRLAFVHASHAAFLAAWHLHERNPPIPRKQVEALLLIAAPDGSKAIPAPLRELAAWMAALDVRVGTWLAEVDPGSLVGHAAYLDTPVLRRSVVAGLLAQAAEFELGDRYWRELNLAYPELADDVVTVLNAYSSQPEDWHDFSRCRVALRLAPNAELSQELVNSLRAIAEGESWNAHLGSLAAKALVQDTSQAAWSKDFLGRLADDTYARERDPDDEIRATILSELWPKHASIAEILPSLRPRRSQLLGGFFSFIRRFPGTLNDSEIPEVLAWAAAASIEPTPPLDLDEDDVALPDEVPIGAIDSMLAAGLIERALRSVHATDVLPQMALLIAPRISRYERVDFPAALDENLTGSTTAPLRRALSLELMRAINGPAPRVDAWHLLHGWRSQRTWGDETDASRRSTLLDSNDFEWAVITATSLAASDDPIAEGFAELVRFLFDPTDIAAIEVAESTRATPIWEHLRHWFDAIPVDSQLANDLRDQQRWTVEAGNVTPEMSEAAAFNQDELQTHFARMVDGDAERFWRVAWHLQFDPETGRGPRRFNDELLSFPSVKTLGPTGPQDLAAAAVEFLTLEHDHADEWLGTKSYDKRAWAGYLALVLLDSRGELGSLPVERFTYWTGAILWFWSVPSETSEAERKTRLLACTSEAASARLADLLPRYVRGQIRNGSSASEVGAFDPATIRSIEPTWQQLVDELREALVEPPTAKEQQGAGVDVLAPTQLNTDEARAWARFTFEQMLAGLCKANADAAETRAKDWSADTREGAALVAATAIAIVVRERPEAWTALQQSVLENDELGVAVANALAEDHSGPLMTSLDATGIADLYRWLSRIFPPEEDPPDRLGASWVSAPEQTRRWRDRALTTLADQSSDEAVLALAALHSEFPSRTSVLANLVRARIAVFSTAWVAPSPAEVFTLLDDSTRRLVRSELELRDVLLETLRAFEADLTRNGQLLWERLAADDSKNRPWEPKPEAALSAFLALYLRLRLQDRGVVVNREVLVKQTDPYGAGDRTDILVETFTRTNSSVHSAAHRVVIEVKGAWNRDLLSAQRDQLALRYLPEADSGVGIYLVGWYPLDLWDPADYRRQRVPVKNADELMVALVAQADELCRTVTAPIVLTVPRPAST